MKLTLTLLVQLLFFSFSYSQKNIKPVQQTTYKNDSIYSQYLQRNVTLSIIIPTQHQQKLSLLLVNDGQDFPALGMQASVESILGDNHILPFLTVGIHCNHERILEYGTAAQADYKNRGTKAGLYTLFVMNELIPYLEHHYSLKRDPEARVLAGFSLGGLSAFDIVWHHANVFSKVGVFSGALWWRQREEGYTDEHDRIIHKLVRAGLYKAGLKFWFEAGTNDEKDDRNNNGIIDAIDDTLDLMKELHQKGYNANADTHYHQVEGGEHNPQTWGKVMPVFLKWAFEKK